MKYTIAVIQICLFAIVIAGNPLIPFPFTFIGIAFNLVLLWAYGYLCKYERF